jgi:hypothetical protein
MCWGQVPAGDPGTNLNMFIFTSYWSPHSVGAVAAALVIGADCNVLHAIMGSVNVIETTNEPLQLSGKLQRSMHM